MEHFYDGQIRRYVGQIIRAISGFKYKASDGKLTTVPVMYGDMTRQVASIIKDNSENKIMSGPRIAVYITGLQMDRSRLGDATHVSKVHIRERQKLYDANGKFTGYASQEGEKYTVERLMPTPYKLTVKADIWGTNTDMKLQIMEQIMMMFNPSLEIQTTDNFVDWSSLSVLELTDINFTSRQIPAGIDSELDIGTLTLEAPIWINPPSKVKRLGVIHDIVMNVFDESYTFTTDERVSVGGFDIFVYYNKSTEQYYAELLDAKQVATSLSLNIKAIGDVGGLNWSNLLDLYHGKYRAGSSQIFLIQPSNHEVVGTIAVSQLDPSKLIISFDQDTYPTNTPVESSYTNSIRGTIDAIVDPQNSGPGAANYGYDPQSLADSGAAGLRFLLINDIGDSSNQDGPDAWKNLDGSDFTAKANEIIEWDGVAWHTILTVEEAVAYGGIVYITNLKTGIQYKLEGTDWTRSFEGEYQEGRWKLIL